MACRYTGDNAYYFLIGVSGRFSIQKLVDNGTPVELATAPNARAINPGRATNTIQAICIGGQNGTSVNLTLIVNGSIVRTVTDSDAPILSGGAGIAVAGQPGLVVEFEDFEFAEFIDDQASG